MPRQSKSKTSEVAETTTAVNTPVVQQQAEKVQKVKKTKAPVVSEPEPVVAAADSAAVPETQIDTADILAQSTEFHAKLNQLSSMIAALKTEYRTLEKKWARDLKAAQKTSAKSKRKSGNRAPSGFVKPTRISDELAKFLERPSGTEMARTDVTREINKYIRSHNLQDKENGRKINPDSKLQSLLKLKKTDELTYFNLQRYMSPHFSKAVKEPVDTA